MSLESPVFIFMICGIAVVLIAIFVRFIISQIRARRASGNKQPIVPDAKWRRALLFVWAIRLLCFFGAVWIGFESHWSGFAWIPIGVLFILAVVGDCVEWICAFFIHLRVIFQAYRIAHDLRYVSAAQRESMLGRMPPELRKLVLFWTRSHVA